MSAPRRCRSICGRFFCGETMEFLGFSICELDKKAIVGLVAQAIEKRRKCHLITVNPEMLARQSQDGYFREVLLRAEILVPDGIGVVWGARFLGTSKIRRLAGIELAEALLFEGARRNWSFYFLGGKEGIAEKAASSMQRRYPGLQVVGTHHGYFTKDEDVLEDINRLRPQVLLVGMGAPRQEIWIDTHREALTPLVFMGVGGSFDVWSGEKRRAPGIFQGLGLEWFWRLGKEPGRLRRIVPSFWRFGMLVFREWMRKRWYNGKR